MSSNYPGATELAADARPDETDSVHWREIIAQIGSEVGLPLSSALERVTTLATTGKIDRAGLRALRDEIECARRASMMGQQIARFGSGRIRQSPEQLSLSQMLREVLLQRTREATARQVEVRQALKPAEVMADATLLHALMQALVDWTLECAKSHIEFKLDIKAWPPYARLVCQFDHEAPELHDTRETGGMPHPAVESLAWRLVEQIAWTLSLVVERIVHDDGTTLALEFPRTITDKIEGVSVVEIDQGFGLSENSKPLAGSHVLILSANREVRAIVKESIRHMGLLVDFVGSVEEAEEFCREALPHAIVYESVLANERFQRLKSGIQSEVPRFAFIEIDAEGNSFELSTVGGVHQRARLGRDTIAQSLPSALIYELSRTL
jgi:hypothetical protein